MVQIICAECDKMLHWNVSSGAILLVFVSSLELSNGFVNGSDKNYIANVSVPNENTSDRTGSSLYKECENGSLKLKCLKIHALSWIEEVNSRSEVPLLPGLSIVKENQTETHNPQKVAAELSRQFSGNPDEKLNRFLMYRLKDYLEGHSLKYRPIEQNTSGRDIAMVKGDMTAVETARGGGGGFGGGGKGGGGFVAAAVMMKGALAAAALAALALLAGKALMTALMSLLLSALVGMKGHGGGGKTTYQIITKPEVSHHHTHSQEEHHEHAHDHHGGYRRAYEPASYDSYMPYDTSSYSGTTT